MVYNTKGYYSETCEVDGDVRINSTALTVSLVPTSWRSEHREWRIRPYSRKTMPDVKMVTVTQLQDKAAAPECSVTYSVPAGPLVRAWRAHGQLLARLHRRAGAAVCYVF